jgi:hypothetical protein
MKNAKFIFTAVNVFALVLGGLIWLLSALMPETFGWFNFASAVVMVCGIWGVSFVLQGWILNEETVMKRSRIIIGGIFVIISAVSLIWAISMPGNIVLPLVCFVVALVLFAGVFITGGKKWDAADNQKEGYKTYRERMEEDSEN